MESARCAARRPSALRPRSCWRSGSVAYASDLGGIQRTVQLWLNGEMTDATLTVNEGSYTLRYPDKDGTEHEMGGGGIAIEDDGTEPGR